MEFLGLWLATIIASYGMEIVSELRMFKDAADAGYKVDVKRLSELGKQLNPNATRNTFLSMLIPIFNMMQVFQRTIQYNNIRPMILDQLSVMDALEEMSEMEKTEYLKNPTGLNALIIPLKSQIRLSTARTIKINAEEGVSEIYYEMGNTLDDIAVANITILKVSGPLSRLTVEEQKQKVVDTWGIFSEVVMDRYKNIEAVLNELNYALCNSTNISLNCVAEESTEKNQQITKELSTSEKKQALENLKKELLEEQEIVKRTKDSKNPTFTKLRD